MADLVRVRTESGQEINVGRGFAERHDLTVLDEPALRGDGRPRRATRKNGRPNKPKTSVAAQVAEKQPPSSGGSEPEEASK